MTYRIIEAQFQLLDKSIHALNAQRNRESNDIIMSSRMRKKLEENKRVARHLSQHPVPSTRRKKPVSKSRDKSKSIPPPQSAQRKSPPTPGRNWLDPEWTNSRKAGQRPSSAGCIDHRSRKSSFKTSRPQTQSNFRRQLLEEFRSARNFYPQDSPSTDLVPEAQAQPLLAREMLDPSVDSSVDPHCAQYYHIEIKIVTPEVLTNWRFQVEVSDRTQSQTTNAVVVLKDIPINADKILVFSNDQLYLDPLKVFSHIEKPIELYQRTLQLRIHAVVPQWKLVLNSKIHFVKSDDEGPAVDGSKATQFGKTSENAVPLALTP